MDDEAVRVQMLGKFSITYGNNTIDDSENRSHKVWLLLAYMIYRREQGISQDELVNLLWSQGGGSGNPVNALKTMFHRVRSMLNQLEPSAGHNLILRQKGSYAWNETVSVTLDVEEFDFLCRAAEAEEDDDRRLKYYLQATQLYQGDFLSRLSSELWVVPIAAYFHNRYVQSALSAVQLLQERGRLQELVDLCYAALKMEPYNETLYQYLMRGLLDLGDQRGAITVYEEMSELLFADFGIMPSEEALALYREAVRTVNDRAIPMGVVREQLREETHAAGALFCEYDFFKVLYQSEARSIARSGDAVHIGLISVLDSDGNELAKRSLDRVMDNLREVVQNGLRRGDIASKCSVSQFILMLPRANYENSCMVCERVIKIFTRQYPHSPAKLNYSVQPLEPFL